MRRTKPVIATFGLLVSASVSAATTYSGDFDYMQFQPSSVYFSGRTDTQIAQLCKASAHPSNTDLAQCAHRDFERASARLDGKINATHEMMASNDKSLEENQQTPLAMPYLLKSDAAWLQYRDSQCYAEVYALGEASERYIGFWQCMTRVTQNRIKELDTFLRN